MGIVDQAKNLYNEAVSAVEKVVDAVEAEVKSLEQDVVNEYDKLTGKTATTEAVTAVAETPAPTAA